MKRQICTSNVVERTSSAGLSCQWRRRLIASNANSAPAGQTRDVCCDFATRRSWQAGTCRVGGAGVSLRVCTIICLLMVNVVVRQVSSSGMFQVQVTAGRNDNSLAADGSPCVDTTSAAEQSAQCRTFLHVCLTNYQSDETLVESTDNFSEPIVCEYAEATSQVLSNVSSFQFPETGNDTQLATDDNVIVLPFTFLWPGSFTLIVESYNDETGAGPQNNSPRQLMSRDIVTCADLLPGANWTRYVDSTSLPVQQQLALDFQYRVLCDTNLFGLDCGVFCRSRDDTFGHYTCSNVGSKVCLNGWQGSDCTQAVCKDGCNVTNALTCSQPFECRCKAGWQGDLCDQCVLAPECSGQHATCSKPGGCDCLPGWGGDYCAIDLNYCTHQKPCSNGGICYNQGPTGFFCSCLPGFTGINCESKLPSPCTCFNGGTCNNTSSVCLCPPGFTGSRCESSLPTGCDVIGCQNGGTCIQSSCWCPAGFTGTSCETQVDPCLQRPCLNGGSCMPSPLGASGYTCKCLQPYTGTNCETAAITTTATTTTTTATTTTTTTTTLAQPRTKTPPTTTTTSIRLTTTTAPLSTTTNLVPNVDLNSTRLDGDDVTTIASVNSRQASSIGSYERTVQLVFMVSLGVGLPVCIFMITGCIWVICKRRSRVPAAASLTGISAIYTSSSSARTDMVVAYRDDETPLPSEAVDNRVNDQFYRKQKSELYGCSDVIPTGIGGSGGGTVKLTFVNDVDEGGGGKGNVSYKKSGVKSASFTRDRCSFRSEPVTPSNIDLSVAEVPEKSVVATAPMECCSDVTTTSGYDGGGCDGRNFKNARRAAANDCTICRGVNCGCGIASLRPKEGVCVTRDKYTYNGNYCVRLESGDVVDVASDGHVTSRLSPCDPAKPNNV